MKGLGEMAKSGLTLEEIMAREPDVDLAMVDATTEEDIRRHMRDDGYDPEEEIPIEDLIARVGGR